MMRSVRAGVLLVLMLGGCSVPKDVNPVEIYRRISGEADAGRPPPPGMDRPRPNLASVPPRPERPPPEVRDAVSAALAVDRERSRDVLAPRGEPARFRAASQGDPAIPAAPPPRASLAGAPSVPWSEGAPRRGRAAPAVLDEPAAPPAMPDLAPAPPPPDLLGAPPPPPRL
ncbi:hypothetical protein JMJ56_03910 [Belnapia sp. T18]|uniref:Uncharacterized protein n=1 Tax=Belnapia arida TaxID=2804533 RepID=A0ABS1TZH7_9PROT|nr:hypothetical protein [Belnapia arida]MBL6077139.1 hypothetical protein [Belnapia arida]